MVEPRTQGADAAAEVVARLSGRAGVYDRYRSGGEIARGGMGAILRVWDEDLQRELAMKVSLADAAGSSAAPADPAQHARLARFLEEAQITGQLEHPGIVPVHELGCDADGRVYFTMKLVKGITLARVLELARDEHDDWSTTRVLDVVLRVCDAMAYAHAKRVIHRDLKPANVMVGAFGEVHVMDWGLARILGRDDTGDVRGARRTGELGVRGVRSDQRDRAHDSPLHTMDGDVLGTPAYMAPEQASGLLAEIGPQADVYAVGAMLYELLAGHPPYLPPGTSTSPIQAWESVRAGPPPSIASLARSAPLELVAICEKAMARDWRDRYADMSALAADLRAFLERRVVAAYRTGTWAETKKWIERNRALAAALVAVVVVLFTGLVVALGLKRRSDRNAALAAESAEETRAAADFQARLLAELSPDELGQSLVVHLRSEIEAGLRRRGDSAEGIDAALAELDRMLGSANPTNVAQRVLAEQIFERAVATLETEYANRPKLGALLRLALGNTTWRLGLHELGERTTRAALESLRTEVGGHDDDTLHAMSALALHLRALGRTDEAEALHRESLEGYRATGRDDHPDALSGMSNLAVVLEDQGRLEEAETLLRDALARTRASSGDVFPPLVNLANVVGRRGANDEAEALLREALALDSSAPRVDRADVLTATNNLAMLLEKSGRLSEAEELLRATLDSLRRSQGDLHILTLSGINNFALVLKHQGRPAEAESLLREAVAGWRARRMEGDPRALTAVAHLGGVLHEQGRLTEAEPLHREAHEGMHARFGAEHSYTITAAHNLAGLLDELGQRDEAEALARDVLEMSRIVRGIDDPETLVCMRALAMMLQFQGRFDEAEPLFREALDRARRVHGEGHERTLRMCVGLAEVLYARRAFVEAETLLTPAVARIRELQPPPKSLVLEAKTLLRDVYRAMHAADPAAGYDHRADELERELQE